MKRNVVFVYATRYENTASTIMRGKQLSDIFRQFYGDQYDISYQELSSDIKNAAVILTKGATLEVSPEQLQQLSDSHNTLLIDPIDDVLHDEKVALVDGVIASSLEAYDAYKKSGLSAFLVNHHVDPRVPRDITPPTDSLRCGYFGEIVNTIITGSIATMVDFIHTDTGKQNDEWFSRLQDYNLHYAIRSDNVQAFKPFLKGFTAATCGANILIQKDQREAIRWLGEDYPYFIDANPSEYEITEMLHYIKRTYGGKEWKKALIQMGDIKQQVSYENITKQLHEMLQSLA